MENTNKNQEPITKTNEAPANPPEERTGEKMVSAQDLEKVVDELKELRKKNAELKEAQDAKVEEKIPTEPSSVTEAVREAMLVQSKLEQVESIKEAKKAAFESFKESNPLFNSSNDPDGSKFKVIEDEFNEYNLDKATTKQDFDNYLSKASLIAGVTKAPDEGSVTTPTHSPTPGSRSGEVNNQAVASLTREERAKAQEKGMTEERFAELKAKYPNMV